MIKLLSTLLTAVGITALLTTAGIGSAPGSNAKKHPPPEPASSEQFAVGQVWLYKTRPAEETSRVIIGKIEKSPYIGTIVHVKLTGLHIQDLSAPGGFISVMTHAPVTEAALSTSVTELSNEVSDLDGFAEAYNTWLSAFRPGGAGVFTLTLSEIVEVMEQTLNQ